MSKTQPPPAQEAAPAKPVSGSSEAFARQAEEASPGLVRELLDFLVYNKAWWITPIIIVLLLVGILIALSATGLAPFIYPLF